MGIRIHLPSFTSGPGSGRAVKWTLLAGGLASLGLAAYLSLRPSPALSTLSWLPGGLARWADAHPRFDNFPAFALFCLPWFLLVSRWGQTLALAGGLILFIGLLESCQLALPTRHGDPWDILWGALGVCAGGLAARAWQSLRARRFCPLSVSTPTR